jgi:P27 family predicted phage terminase small subunit
MAGMRADRIPTGEPQAPSGAPECPERLDDYEREGWAAFVRDVQLLGLLSVVDGHAATVYATAYGRGRRFDDEIRERGVMVEGAHGGLIVNPAVAAKERCERIMVSVLSLYGLTPSDRSRLRAGDPAAVEDEFEKFKREHAS